MKSLNNFPSWEKQKLYIFRTKDHGVIRIVTEFNTSYGELIRFFQINNTFVSPVRSKYTNNFLEFDASNSLIGERAFEKNSIVYEFLLKPLGIEPPEGKLISSFYYVRDRLERMGN